MERFVKYIYFHHKREEFKKSDNLYDLIKECKDEKFFSKEVKKNQECHNFFQEFRKKVRVPQIHILPEVQTKGMSRLVLPIKIPKNSDGEIIEEEFLKVLKESREKIFKKGKIMSTSEHPAIADSVKIEMDNEIYLDKFCDLNRIMLELNKINNLDHTQKIIRKKGTKS